LFVIVCVSMYLLPHLVSNPFGQQSPPPPPPLSIHASLRLMRIACLAHRTSFQSRCKMLVYNHNPIMSDRDQRTSLSPANSTSPVVSHC
jgi:hypothetical protein